VRTLTDQEYRLLSSNDRLDDADEPIVEDLIRRGIAYWGPWYYRPESSSGFAVNLLLTGDGQLAVRCYLAVKAKGL